MIIGTSTANGIIVTGQSEHFIERVIGTMGDPNTGKHRAGVPVSDVVDAIHNPLEIGPVKIGAKGKPSQKFTGAYGTVSINPETEQLIQCNPTKSEKRKRLMKRGKHK